MRTSLGVLSCMNQAAVGSAGKTASKRSAETARDFPDSQLPDSQEETQGSDVEILAIQERVKKQKMDPGDVRRLMENTASTAVSQMMPKFNESFNAHKNEMKTLMSKQDQNIENKLAAMQSEINGLRTGKSSAASMISTTASVVGTGSDLPRPSAPFRAPNQIFDRSIPFCPNWVKFQGFCTNWATREGSVKSPAADVWIDDFMQCLNEADSDLAGKVDINITKRKGGFHVHNALHIRLKPNSTSQDEAYRIKGYMDEFAKNEASRLRNPWMAANECYGLVEPAPWRKPHLDRGGRAKSSLIKRGCPNTSIKVEYGPPTRLYEVVGGEMMLPEIVKHSSKQGWQLMDAEKWGRLCGNMTFDDFKAEMEE